MAEESKITAEEEKAPSSAQSPEKEDKKAYRKRYFQIVRSTLAVLIVAAAVAVLVAMLVMPVLQIYGSSMSPTLDNEQIVISLKGGELEKGDLVAFYYGNKLLVKRVIACPGDWILIEGNGDVYVNGELLDEPYVKEKALGECDQTFPLQMGEERWFLMGDNRAVSVDSRSTALGLVSSEQMVGKIVFRIWPFSEIGKVE